MKLLLVALASCLLGTAVGVGALLLTESVGAADLLGFVPLMFVPALVMCGVAYTPGLFWLKWRKGGAPAAAFPLVAGGGRRETRRKSPPLPTSGGYGASTR